MLTGVSSELVKSKLSAAFPFYISHSLYHWM